MTYFTPIDRSTYDIINIHILFSYKPLLLEYWPCSEFMRGREKERR